MFPEVQVYRDYPFAVHRAVYTQRRSLLPLDVPCSQTREIWAWGEFREIR